MRIQGNQKQNLQIHPDEEELEDLKETAMEQKNELAAKNKEAGKPQTKSSSSNPDEDKSEEMKENKKERRNELVAKTEEEGNHRQNQYKRRIHDLTQVETNQRIQRRLDPMTKMK